MSESKQESANLVDPTRKKSRRGFLTGSTAALATVAAATAFGERAVADPPGCSGGFGVKSAGIFCKGPNLQSITHHLNDPALVNVVVRAWTDFGYFQQLTDPSTTKDALEFMGVTIPEGKDPIVIKQNDFETVGHTVGPSDDVILYVLPHPPVGGGATGQAARDAMAAVPFGM